MSKLFIFIRMKRRGIGVIGGICFVAVLIAVHIFNNEKILLDAKRIQEGIALNIIRFHVIANSDSKEDQDLKIKVKDEVVLFMKQALTDASDKDEAREIIKENMDAIKGISDNVIKENGYTYQSYVSLANVYFPVKRYEKMTFPSGEYEALRIQIGKASGRNWWCVMFPPLCFVDATYSIVPDSSDETLRYVLTDEEYDSLIKDKKTKIKIKFKLFDFLKEKIY